MHRPLPRLAAVVLVCAAFVVACGGGGDNRPPTVVTGNVRSSTTTTSDARGFARLWRLARAWWSAAAIAQVPGVTVAIENTAEATSTDTQGFFRLETDRFGPSTLDFTAGTFSARFPVTLPAGGQLDLINVDIVGNDILIEQQRLQFEGPITGVDCQGNLLQVLSGSLVPYRVRLTAATSIVDDDGVPLRCIDLTSGTAEVAGTVNDTGDVVALTIRFNPSTSSTPTPEDVVDGLINARHCPTDFTVASNGGNVVVNLSGATVIKDTNGDTIGCTALATGDKVHAEGRLGSFGLDATTVDRLQKPTPTPSATPTPKP